MTRSSRVLGLLTVVLLAAVAAPGAGLAAPAGPPIRVGGSLALTGPLAATALVHKIVGEIYVDELNRKNGLLGRPVEWVLLDDQSKPDLARTLYERLITVDKVDLLIGPYATGSILSAMGVAQRYDKLLVHHTFGIPHLAKYERQFPAWALGPEPGRTFPNLLFDALAASPKPPQSVAIVTDKFPSVHFVSTGAREIAQKRGSARGAVPRVRVRHPGLRAHRGPDQGRQPGLPVGGRDRARREPDPGRAEEDRLHAEEPLLPLPGAGAAREGARGQGRPVDHIFEEHPPFTSGPVATEFVKLFRERATKAGLPYTAVDVQAAASYTAWQLLEAAVTATKGLDDKALAQWLKTNRVDTITGKLRFDGPNNYGDDLSKVKQVQDGKWLVVWPKEYAAPGAQLLAP